MGQGGDGVHYYTSSASGAGGGGYYGGGSGACSDRGDGDAAGGGGGSNYTGGATAVTTNQRGGSTGDGEVVITYETLTIPSVSASYVADDQIDVTITDSSADEYDVQMRRDGGSWESPAGGPSSPSSTGTYSYGPAGDTAYGRQVGVDSSFEFRVRWVSGGTTGDWAYSGTVKTSPLPPHDPSVSRPDASTIQIHGTVQSDISSKIRVEFREDIGNGYNDWSGFDLVAEGDTDQLTSGSVESKGSDFTFTYETGESYPGYSGDPLNDNARYQFRLRTWNDPNGTERKVSKWVYADYGNEGNVFLDTQFDTESWDYEAGSPELWSSEITDIAGGGPQYGSNSALIRGGEDIEFDLAGLDSSPTDDVVVLAWVGVGSMDAASEDGIVEWYDGSSWQQISGPYGWEYNKQGWFQVHATVPASYIEGGNNNLRIGNVAGSADDYLAVDRVVVSDILHEYTEPATPSNLSLDVSTQREITGTWDLNASVADTAVRDTETWFAPTDESLNGANRAGGLESYTFDGLLDGERYRLEVNDSIIQYRRGSAGLEMDTDRIGTEATTILPAPTGFAVSNVTDSTADYAWQSNHNYGDVLVQFKPTDAGSWTTVATRDLNATTETVTGLRNGEAYDARVVANTEHAQTEDDS